MLKTILVSLLLLYPVEFNTESKRFVKIVPYSQLSTNQKHQVDCLTDNIYYEARGEGFIGMVAVGEVTMNRYKDSKIPICKIVYLKNNSVCQFSWVCKQHSKKKDRFYETARKIALLIYFNPSVYDTTHGAKFFHANYVNPKWNKDFTLVASIGKHVFYTE